MGVRRLFDHTADGANHLSPFEHHLWNLTYECLLRFGCPVLFRVTGPNAPQRIDQFIEFYVPMHNPRCTEVVNFLREELKSEMALPKAVSETEYHWGKFVCVREFDGLHGYIDSATSSEMAEKFVQDLMTRLTEERKKQ